MNIPYLFTKQQLTARFFAALTIVSLLLTAFPAALFVAEAANTNAVGTVTVSVLPNQPSGTSEYFTVTFTGTGTLDLAGWTVSDTLTSPGLVYTFGATTLTNGQSFKVCGSTALGVGCNAQSIGGNAVWNNTGDTLVLKDETSATILSAVFGATVEGTEYGNSVTVNYAPLACTPQFNVTGPTSVKNATTNEFFNSVNDAIADCDTVNGNTVELWGNISISQQITINKSITLDGNDFTISPTFTRTDPTNNASIGIIDTNNVIIKELKIDGTAGTNLHGINVYQSNGVNINDTSITNPKRTGVVVNGSNVTVNNLTTSGSTWHSINAAPGTGVTAPTVLTVNGVSVHGEAAPTPHIYTDDTSKNVTVNDTNNQYEVVYNGPNPQNTQVTAKSWRLKTTPVTPCNVSSESVANTTFDTFSLGNVNGQNGWMSTGAFDQKIVTNTYGFTSFGCKSLRISNAVTSGSFGDQTFAAPLTDSVGETIATNGSYSMGTKFNRYEAQFDIASTKQAQQTGLRMTVSPDRGDGSRMSFLAFEDTASGINVVFNEVLGTGPISFVPTTIATIDRNPHTIKLVVITKEGASNDIVEVYIDGVLKHTGTSWENYYRFDPEASAEQTPRIIKTLLFRSSATAAPATNGEGFLFDNMSLKALNQPETVKVRIYKYLQTGQTIAQVPDNATAPSFPMNAVWNATNIGAGSGNYVLGNTHGGAAFRYAADTSPMSVPADYTTTEITGGDSPVLPIGAECSEGKYRLVGYKQGDSVALAEAAALTSAAPVYTDITTDKYIIVVNEKCADAPKPICAIGENLIQNGSFENTPAVTDHDGQWQIFSSISNWMVSLSDGLEVWKNFNGTGAGLASDGMQNVELDGNDATKISQSIATVPGATYELKFDYSARAATAVADSKMDAMIDGTSVLSLNTDGSAATANVWEPKTKNFVATGAATVVSFEDKGVANADGGYGPLLDNVAVCLVSIPRCEIAMTSSTNTVIDSTNYAVETYNNHPSWTASIPGAKWVWSTFYVNDANVDETRVFTETFAVNGASSALLDISADNSYKVFVNGTLVLDRSAIENNFMSFAQKNDVDIKSFLVNGSNELKIEVKNLAQPGGSKLTNPAGVLYRLDIVGQSSCEVTTKVKPPVVVSPVDVCRNLEGPQATIPSGYEKVGESMDCTQKAVVAVDVCLNIPNTQTTVPEGFAKASENSDCIAIQTTVVETNNSGGGNGGGNRNSARSTRAAQGQVLGASTSQCGMYLFDYMKEGATNDAFEVKKLQWFLVGQGYFIPTTGIFDDATDEAVKTFQMKYQSEVLTPWFTAGLVPHQNPTGWMYQLTRWKINNIVCPGSEAMPVLIP